MAMLKFNKGLLANLPSAKTEGYAYITTDERALYVDIDSNTRLRIGDFQEFATLEELQGNTNPSTTALYYVTDLNVLAKWNGSGYVQINLDTGATSIEVVGSGNAVTEASYNPTSRKLTLTKGATYTTSTDVSGAIETAIGELGDKEEGVPYSNVKDYIDTKIADVVAGSIEGLGALASKDKVAETDLDTALATKINGKADLGTSSDASTVTSLYGVKKYAQEQAAAAQTAAEGHADDAIAALDTADTPVATQLVSAVSQEDGKINVQRRALVEADIPTLSQDKVTGLTAALAGKQDTVVFNTAYDAESNKAATMADVTEAVAGLSGAMHYVGESTTDPSTGTATVSGVDEFVKGDVVTYNAKEYVYDGSAWRELGDESSYAVKGSIKNADIAADAAIDQSKIAGLTDALAAKATPQNITDAIGALDVTDEAVSGQLVSAVVETDGKIAVSRRALVADDIPAITTSKVTGLDTALAGKASASDLDALEELVGETAVATQITNAIGALDNNDVAVTNQFLTAAVQTDGAVVVSRAQPTIENVSGLTTALSSAESNAKDYADGLLEWGTF